MIPKHHKIRAIYNNTQENINKIDELIIKEIKVNETLDFNTIDFIKNIVYLDTGWGEGLFSVGRHTFAINIINFPIKLIPSLKYILLYEGEDIEDIYHWGDIVKINDFNQKEDTFNQISSITLLYNVNIDAKSDTRWRLLIGISNPQNFI